VEGDVIYWLRGRGGAYEMAVPTYPLMNLRVLETCCKGCRELLLTGLGAVGPVTSR